MTVETTAAHAPGALIHAAYTDVSAYQESVSRKVVPLAVEGGARDFSGSVAGRQFGPTEILSIRTSQHTITRDQGHISQKQRGAYKFCLQMTGTGLIRQGGREAVLRPGDIAFYDADRPYSLATTNDNWSMILLVPRDQLAVRPQSAAELTAVRMSGDGGISALVSGFLGQLVRTMGHVSVFDGARLAQNTVDLCSTLVSSELGLGGQPKPTADQPIMDRIHTYIESHLGDPDLSPPSIAAAMFISVRTLHGLFQHEGHSVSAWIKARRLDCAKADLGDPRMASTPVAAIAARWGMLDAPNFSRSFKATFGESPTDFRRRMCTRPDLTAPQGLHS